MDAIKSYIDNVFAAFPKTEKASKFKREMLAGMEEKYRELKADGKSEHEAVGGVIAGFGSIDEIAAELGAEPGAAAESGLSLSALDAREYLAQSRKSGILVGGGVALIIAGVAALVLISKLTGTGGIGVFVLLVLIAAAVSMFIVSGNRMEKYEDYEEKDIRLDEQTRAELEKKRAAYMPRHAAKICAGIAIILLAVGGVVLLGDGELNLIGMVALRAGDPANALLPETLWIPALLLVVAAAVFLFVSTSYDKEALDALLGRGEYTRENRRIERAIGVITAVYWPLATVVFLLWGFIGNAWGTSWLVWPVAGIAYGAIWGVAETLQSRKNK